ncbi:alpha/beta hydrolase [Deltaproteobacteria bacterium OttesenSCG-928-K17]|nr:alpha/beta hydrolase [Deltaproteobacteria bacterium OttesenSCG-928-K17]
MKNLIAPPKWEKGRFAPWLLKRILSILVLFSVILLAGGLIFKDRLIFHPVGTELSFGPEQYSLKYEEKWLTTADGLKVKAWRLPPKGPDTGLTLIFLQGNSGNMSLMLDRLSVFSAMGLTCLSVDYPGYGESKGRPSEEKLYQTAEALYSWAEEKGAKPGRTIIYGFSLGGGVASYLAEKKPSAALVLDSTFTRLRDVPGHDLPFLRPYLKLILGDAFNTNGRLADINCPLLVLHSPQDDVVPYALGLKNYETYTHQKIMAIGRGDHMSFMLNRKLYVEKMEELIKKIEETKKSQSGD